MGSAEDIRGMRKNFKTIGKKFKHVSAIFFYKICSCVLLQPQIYVLLLSISLQMNKYFSHEYGLISVRSVDLKDNEKRELETLILVFKSLA
jgi:hypothetical protein